MQPQRAPAQRAQRAPAATGYSLEYNRRLSNRILHFCNEQEYEEVFPNGSSRTFDEIIFWARRQTNLHLEPATRAPWMRFLYP